jgi:hypothetical protein
MELLAAIRALEALKGGPHRSSSTPTSYVKDGISGWIHGWKRNGWKTAAKKPVKNAELWQALDGCRKPPRHPLALGQGPCRPSRKRTRRRTGARGHGTLQDQNGAPLGRRKGIRILL